jgi:hypothetical protein
MKPEISRPGGVQAFSEFFREALRPAEPDLGGTGPILGGQHAGSGQHFSLLGTMHLQVNAGQGCAKRLQAGDERIGFAIPRAVMQVGGGGLPGVVLKRFQPGDKGCDANAAGNPDLLRPRIPAGNVKRP